MAADVTELHKARIRVLVELARAAAVFEVALESVLRAAEVQAAAAANVERSAALRARCQARAVHSAVPSPS